MHRSSEESPATPPVPLHSVGWLAATAVAGALGLWHLARPSLSGDEAFSLALARSEWSQLWAVTRESQANMAFYNLLLKPWTAVFGSTETAVRSLSTLLAVATVPVLCLLASRLFGHRTAVAAGLLLAVNAFFIEYAQEARSYVLLMLLVTASTYLFTCLAETPADRRLAAAYVVVSVIAAGAHVFAVFVLAAHGLTAVVTGRHGRAVSWPDSLRRSTVVCPVAALALATPLLLMILLQDQGQVAWVAKPSVLDVAYAVRDLSGGNKFLLLGYLSLGAAAVVPAARARRAGRPYPDRWALALVLTWLAVPVLGSVALSYLVKPLFVPRYLIVALPPLVLLAARGLAALPRPGGAVALALVMVLAAGALPYNRDDYEEVDFRAATTYLLERARPGDGALFYRPSRRLGFEYYSGQRGDDLSGLIPLHPASPWGRFDLTGDYLALRLTPPDLERLAAWAERRRVWLFFSHEEPVASTRRTAAAVTEAVESRAVLAERRRFTGLDVRLYVPSA